ncbi:MAG: hypothetical protein RQ756_04590 [Flavobacteriaceae bacterium]|nr:hypothetical protein [Flavobacteriaceae bacterium]
MKKLLFCLAMLPLMLLGQTNEPQILSMLEITVKQGHHAQFMDGMKKWKECYIENKGSDNYSVWRRVQGEGTVYVISGMMANWAEMDKEDPASDACYTTVLNFIMPHVSNVANNYGWTMPKISRNPMQNTKVGWVTFFRVNSSSKFMEVVNAITDAMKAKEGTPRGLWTSVIGGGVDAPDYFVMTPFQSFAEMDKDRDGVWKVLEDAIGKKKKDEMQEQFQASVDDIWSYMYTLNSELSF